MSQKLKVRVSKCYLVQVIDEEGNELDLDYVFTDRKGAEQRGKELKEELLRKEEV